MEEQEQIRTSFSFWSSESFIVRPKEEENKEEVNANEDTKEESN